MPTLTFNKQQDTLCDLPFGTLDSLSKRACRVPPIASSMGRGSWSMLHRTLWITSSHWQLPQPLPPREYALCRRSDGRSEEWVKLDMVYSNCAGHAELL